MAFVCFDCKETFNKAQGLGLHQSRYCKEREKNRENDLKEMVGLLAEVETGLQEGIINDQIIEENQEFQVNL